MTNLGDSFIKKYDVSFFSRKSEFQKLARISYLFFLDDCVLHIFVFWKDS